VVYAEADLKMDGGKTPRVYPLLSPDMEIVFDGHARPTKKLNRS